MDKIDFDYYAAQTADKFERVYLILIILGVIAMILGVIAKSALVFIVGLGALLIGALVCIAMHIMYRGELY